MLTAAQLIRLLNLQPLHPEGGYFAETYRSPVAVHTAGDATSRVATTAIYYLLTDTTCSRLHRLRNDELWHFYVGDAVEMVQLAPHGAGQLLTLGHDLANGQRCQTLVPAGTWQGARLLPGGRWALMGCTVAPGFEFADFEVANRAALCTAYPDFSTWIEALT